ncbi:hypothetical protein ACFP65_08425 [Marinilactibacillus sp. GCM10026970]|uniref:hypothetical protein n=1 Tax=Marinilactibacillus sp. GCM10026970 TaxID=3252642 RepID=UPI0036171D37
MAETNSLLMIKVQKDLGEFGPDKIAFAVVSNGEKKVIQDYYLDVEEVPMIIDLFMNDLEVKKVRLGYLYEVLSGE